MLNYSFENWFTLIGGLAILLMGMRIYWLDTENNMYRAFLGATFFMFIQNWLFFEMDRIKDFSEVIILRPWQESSWNIAVVFIVLTLWYYAKQFTLRPMKKWEQRWLWTALLLSPPFIFLQAFTDFGHGTLILNEQHKWAVVIHDPAWYDYARAFWCLVTYSLTVYLAFQPARYSKYTNMSWIRWAIFFVFGLIMLTTFIQNYVITIYFDQSTVINESINVFVGALFSGLMIINLQFYDLQSQYAVPNLMKTMTNWFILTDDKFRIKRVNEAFLKMLGRNLSYWQNTEMSIVFGKDNEEWVNTMTLLQEVKEHEHISFEIKIEAKGQSVFLLFVITPIIQYRFWKLNKSQQGYAFVGTDLSEFKLSEERIRAYATDLETSNKALERFAYIASHDLKEPIRNIGNFAGLLRRRLANESRPEIGDYLNFIEQNVNGMNKLIEAVMTVSRLGQEELAFNSVDIQEIVKKVTAGNLNRKRGGEVFFEIAELPDIVGDQQLLLQLFQNLLENAIKYNTNERPTIKISTEPAKDPNYCTIRIEDNGIGISLEYRKQVFEMFKRLHSRAAYEGTGIGLAICRRIVELHQGEIWIEDTRFFPSGTAFLISLPCFIEDQ